MRHERWIQEVVRRARDDAPAPFDVTGEVLLQIRGQRPEQWDPMPLFAGSAAAAAIIIVAYAVQAVSTMSDPFAAMLGSMNLVLQ